MSQTGSDLFNLADRRLAFLQQRQIVLAQNVANANTPGWQARDMKPFDAMLATKLGVVPVRTNARHLAGQTASAAGTLAVQGERSPDGNSVRLDDQLSKVADTETLQSTVTNLYSKFLGFYRTALGR
jgi:flagellar basal-body rod protein FlgB